MPQSTDLRTCIDRRPNRRRAAFAGTCAAALVAGSILGFAPQAQAGIVGDGVQDGVTALLSATAQRTVTVTGTASVSVAPDVADLSLAVQAEGADAAALQDEAAQTVDAVKAALVEFGVPEDGVTTSDVSLYPIYDYSSEVETVTGYRIYVGIAVKGLAVDQVGEAVAVATGAGANVVNNASYYCSDYDAQYQQALLDALLQARAKADAIAGATGDEVVTTLNVTEGYENRQYRLTTDMAYAADEAANATDAGAGGAAKSIDIDPGTIEIEATVTVEYSVAPVGTASAETGTNETATYTDVG